MTNNERAFYDQLEAMAAEAGVTMDHKSGGHYHLRGTLLVNYWPFSKQQSAHVAGAKDSITRITPQDALRMAQGLPPLAWVDTLNVESMKRVMGPTYAAPPTGGGKKRKARELATAMLPDDHPLKQGSAPWA